MGGFGRRRENQTCNYINILKIKKENLSFSSVKEKKTIENKFWPFKQKLAASKSTQIGKYEATSELVSNN